MTYSILNKYVAFLIICLSQIGFSSAQVNLNNGLVLHLPFNGDFKDASGNQNITLPKNLTFTTNCSQNADKAAYFNGNNSLIEIPASISLNSTEQLTISLWIYSETTGPQTKILNRAKEDLPSSLKGAYALDFSSTFSPNFKTVTPPFCFDWGNWTSGNTSIAGKWHSLIAIYDGVQMSLYIDGKLSSQIDVSFNRLQFCEAYIPLFIGAAYASESGTFKGSMDDIRIYSRAITADEIKVLAQACEISYTCPSPTDPLISDLTQTGAMISWSSTANSLSHELQYKERASNNWTTISLPNTARSVQLSGLTLATTYDFRVKAICSTDSSGWINGQFITNNTQCDLPFDLQASNVTETGAYIAWKTIPAPESNLQYRPVGASSWIVLDQGRVEQFYQFSGLTPGTEYEWRVQAICGTSTSEWEVTGFVTAGVAPCQAPFNLLPADISGNRAALKWTAWQGSTYYEVEYKAATSTQWIRTTPTYFSYEIEYIDSLQPLTAYNWRVRAICANGTSAWTESSFVTTSGNPIPSGIVFIADFSFKADPCAQAKVSFTDASIVKVTTIRSAVWNFDDGSFSTELNPVHTYKKIGSYNVVLTIIEDGGRTSTKLRRITVNELDLSFAEAGDDITVCSNEPIALKASGGSAYAWSPCTGLNNCNNAETVVTPGLQERYVVTVTNSNGCKDMDTLFVKYRAPDEPIYIPNAFTPNNDGLNDLFRPMSRSRREATEWKVYDRFGNNVYTSSNASGAWDGTTKGKPLPAGTYAYRIRIAATGFCPARLLKGTVTLIR